MAVKIRLKRLGRRKRPFFRVVAIDSRSRRDGVEIERLGWYDPLAEGSEKFHLKEDRIMHWLEVGAQPSNTVKSFLTQEGISLKWHLKRSGRSPEEIAVAVADWEKQRLDRQRRKEALETQKKRAVKPEVEEVPAAEAEPGREVEAEAAAEAVSTEETPAEEAPAEEAPAEKAPAEEAAAEESRMEETTPSEKAEAPQDKPEEEVEAVPDIQPTAEEPVQEAAPAEEAAPKDAAEEEKVAAEEAGGEAQADTPDDEEQAAEG